MKVGSVILKVMVISNIRAQNTPLVDQLRLLQAQALGKHFDSSVIAKLVTLALTAVYSIYQAIKINVL